MRRQRVHGLKGWLLLALLAAAFLRLHRLPDAPPGLTHDEADHGLTAWEIVQGERAIYFTIGYGREPLFDYATAGMMALIGPTVLAGRLTSVYASLLLLAAMAAWARLAFGARTAVLTAAGLAVSFWPLMTGRQMLRSTLLPTLFVFSLLFFWRALIQNPKSKIQNSLLAGLFLGLTFYVYIPARALWLALLVPAGWVAWRQRERARRQARRVGWITAVTLATAGLTAWPLFRYLARNPGVEARVTELSSPLRTAMAGDWRPLWTNVAGSLRLFFIEGDSAWRYNIPGRPWLPPLWALLFVAGLGAAVWLICRARQSPGQSAAALTALAWLGLGLSPALVTGPELATTQAIGMQPVLYLFPALALAGLGKLAIGDWRLGRFSIIVALFLFGGTAVFAFRDYFVTWANAPEVRVQYETAMMTAMAYLNEQGTGAAAISTITPAPEHTPALALLTLRNEAVTPRYFDGRGSLLLPDAPESVVIVPRFTPLALAYFWETAVLFDVLPMRPTDADRPLQVFQVNQAAMIDDWRTKLIAVEPATLGGAATLLGFSLSSGAGKPILVVTWWRIERPLPNAQLFIHLQGAGGPPIAQDDRLDVPGAGWLPGDQFLQLHTITLPPDTPMGLYPLAVGLCQQTAAGCVRLAAADGREFLTLTIVSTP